MVLFIMQGNKVTFLCHKLSNFGELLCRKRSWLYISKKIPERDVSRWVRNQNLSDTFICWTCLKMPLKEANLKISRIHFELTSSRSENTQYLCFVTCIDAASSGIILEYFLLYPFLKNSFPQFDISWHEWGPLLLQYLDHIYTFQRIY